MTDITFTPSKITTIIGTLVFGGIVYGCISLYGGYGDMFAAALDGKLFARLGVILTPFPIISLIAIFFPIASVKLTPNGIIYTELWRSKPPLPWSEVRSIQKAGMYIIIDTVSGTFKMGLPSTMNKDKIIEAIQSYTTSKRARPVTARSSARLFG